MTTKLIDNMNLNCAVKLLRYDELSTSNNEGVDSLANNEPITEVKRSVRILSRKRTKPIKANGNKSDSVQNKKCMIKKLKLSKIEPGNTDNSQKEPKTIKMQDSSSVTSTESYLINDNLSVTSGSTPCPNYFIDDEEELSMQSSLKPAKIKISKSIICVKKQPIMRDINNDDSSNKIVKADNLVVPLKSPKTKTPKYITSNRKKPVLSNVSKNNTSYELGESNSVISTKTPKNRRTKSITPNKKKSMTNIINDDELEINHNFAEPQVPKSKSSKSIVSNKKKLVVNNMNNSVITNEHKTSNKIEISRKRGRTSLTKEKCQKPDFGNIYNEDNLEQTQNSGLICNVQYSDEKLMLSQNVDDNTMMLRSNNKPPKIKKKWSEEWSGNKLSTNVSKSNNEEFSSEPTLDVNNTKMFKKNLKNQKTKNFNCKKVKTQMLQPFIPNNPVVLYTPTPAYDNTDSSYMNVPMVQNDGISITYHIPLEESIPVVYNDVVSEPVTVCNIPSCESSSNISIIHTTGTESTFSNENVQQSHLGTLEPISDSNYLSVPTISTENPEMSYGMAILSEAISRQSRELANEHIKKKSPEPDFVKVQFSPKNADIASESQVPSAMASSSHRYVKHMSSKELKCPQFVEKELLSHIEHEINLLSKRFDISSNYLRKTVVEEPLSVFQNKYSKLVTPSAVEVTPIDVNAKSGLNVNYVGGNIDVEYKLDPIRESAAYEKYNLKDLMLELSKTMPSWSLSIVTNPTRYVISHMSIGMYGIPTANKCIVLDRMFKASVYINQSLEHKLCKRYTTATEIVNLIKDLNSI